MDLVSDLKGKEIKWVCLNEFVDYIVLGCGVFIEVVYLKIIEMVSEWVYVDVVVKMVFYVIVY